MKLKQKLKLIKHVKYVKYKNFIFFIILHFITESIQLLSFKTKIFINTKTSDYIQFMTINCNQNAMPLTIQVHKFITCCLTKISIHVS